MENSQSTVTDYSPTSAPYPGSTYSSQFDQHHDLNSVEDFKVNLNIATDNVARIKNLTERVISTMENAYQIPQSNIIADLAELKEAVALLKQHLLSTGVGALPILSDPEVIPTEETLLEEMSKAVQVKYDRLKGIQDNAAVANNLLSR